MRVGLGLVILGLTMLAYEAFLSWPNWEWVAMAVCFIFVGGLVLSESEAAQRSRPYDWSNDR